MKYPLLIFVYCMMLLSSCNFSVNTSSKAEDNNESQFQSTSQLVGKTIAYQYGESIYHVTFDSDSTMHWEAMAGEEKGALEHEKYIADFIQPNMLFISWGEANGINVSQVLDFKNGIVYNHLIKDRGTSAGSGEIRVVN